MNIDREGSRLEEWSLEKGHEQISNNEGSNAKQVVGLEKSKGLCLFHMSKECA